MVECKLKQGALARSVGISQGYLSDIISGKKTPSETLLKAITGVYGYSFNWLAHGQGEKHPKKGVETGAENSVVSEDQESYGENEMKIFRMLMNKNDAMVIQISDLKRENTRLEKENAELRKKRVDRVLV